MKRDGEHYWIELTGLTPQQEYAFQYLVNESLWIADPIVIKFSIQMINTFLPIPIWASHLIRRKPIMAWIILTDCQPSRQGKLPYNWTVTHLSETSKERLVFMMLIRDYFENGERNYQNLIDT